jgi:hypothetical protein
MTAVSLASTDVDRIPMSCERRAHIGGEWAGQTADDFSAAKIEEGRPKLRAVCDSNGGG